MITDHDAGVAGGPAVTHTDVLEIFASNIDRLKDLLSSVIARLPEPEADEKAECNCRRGLDGISLPFVTALTFVLLGRS